MEFNIRKCNNVSRAANGKSLCATDTDIDNFIYDLQVDEWVIYEEMDTVKYFEKPTTTRIKIISS